MYLMNFKKYIKIENKTFIYIYMAGAFLGL